MKTRYALQEWAADRFKFVQYPKPKRMVIHSPQKPKIKSFGGKVVAVVVGSTLILFGVSGVAAGAFVIATIIKHQIL